MRHTRYAREMKKWGLKGSTKAQKHSALSGVVYVADEEGKGSCRVRFAQDFVEAVGRALPQGISPLHPAYIKVLKVGTVWRVMAYYLRTERGVILWETEDKPNWIVRVKRRKHEQDQESTRGAGYPVVEEEVRRLLREHLRGARGL